VRIWDIAERLLCDKHLLGEHHELHCIWSILTGRGRGGYERHPETKRWRGKLSALYKRHDRMVREMQRRGFNHKSPLDKKLATGLGRQMVYVHTREEQHSILKSKGCLCRVS